MKFLITIEIFCFLFILTALNLNGQDNDKKYYQVKGQIRDAESKNIIEFANIGIEGKPIGTVTNKAGRFDFKFEEQYINDTLFINAMGFNVYKIALSDALAEKQFTIFLEPQPFNISEITIIEIPTMEIINRALERIDENHTKNNYVLEGFYREHISENNSYKRLIEASIKVLEQTIKSQFFIPFLDPVKQITQVVEIDEIKTNEDLRELKTYDWNGIKYLLNENIHGQNAGGVLNTYELSDWKFNNTHTTTLHGEKVFVVEFKSIDKKAPRPEGTIYIAMSDYAIVQLDYAINEEMLENWHLTRLSNNSVSKYYTWHTSFSYKRFEGKMFLNYITHQRNFDVLNVSNGDGLYDIQISTELLINNIYKQGVRNGITKNIADDYNSALLEKRDYNETYWENFNLPVADEEMILIYKDIEENKLASISTPFITPIFISNLPLYNDGFELDFSKRKKTNSIEIEKEELTVVEPLQVNTNITIVSKSQDSYFPKLSFFKNVDKPETGIEKTEFEVTDPLMKKEIIQINNNEYSTFKIFENEKVEHSIVQPIKKRVSIGVQKEKIIFELK